ncbi:MAG: ribonuclease D [Rhodospirillales bacterium]|nr:ribonuclease D [Rhodospirillales bacterium]MCB9996936.1 ribonuclease D [Rhodospirillales bacterium]
MTIIKDNKALTEICTRLAGNDFLTIDTEFLRDKTYYPRLCLIQLAGPGIDPVAVDPLEKGLDMAPLIDLLNNEKVVKVFHAARQDLEIFYNLTGKIPHPIFDTQVAAMVCGYGEQVGYNNLINDICKVQLDKGAQFTDWSRRPLSKRQLSYALDDVTYLRDAYTHLSAVLEKRGRTKWVNEEMEILTDPATYENPPDQAWQRIKIKSTKPRVLAVLREVAAWREREAQRRDIPRGRVLRDETLADLAVHPPKVLADLKNIRNLPGDIAGGRFGQQLLDAVKKGLDTDKKDCPVPEIKPRLPQDLAPVVEMLKMLLRIQASTHEVAAKLIASASDLEALAMDDKAAIPAAKGWRHEIFGKEALAMKHGKVALSLKNNQIHKKEI